MQILGGQHPSAGNIQLGACKADCNTMWQYNASSGALTCLSKHPCVQAPAVGFCLTDAGAPVDSPSL